MYKLHEKCYKSVISRDDSVCSSYMGLYLQVSIQLMRYVHEICETQCLSPVRQLQGWSPVFGTEFLSARICCEVVGC